MPDAREAAGGDDLRRVLGLGDAAAVVIGAIIGVGIFFTPSRVAALAGSTDRALAAWAVGALIALLGALTFAELGALYPRTGGQYEILRDAFGPATAFVFVVCNATAVQAGGIAIIALVTARHVGSALGIAAGGKGSGSGLLIPSLVLIALLAMFNVLGVRWGARIQNATVAAKLLTLLFLTALAVVVPPLASAAVPPAGGAGAGAAAGAAHASLALLLAAVVPTLFAFGGWQQALWVGGEVKNPARNLPAAILGGVAVVAAVYLSACWAYFRLLGFAGVASSTALAADAVARSFPEWGSRAIAGAVALSALGVLNAQFLSGPRLLYAMARDGRFFAPVGRASANGTPAVAIVLLAVMSALLLIAGGEDAISKILTGVVFVDGVFFALTGASLLVLRRRQSSRTADATEGPPPSRIPGHPLVPLLFVLGETAVVIGAYVDPEVRHAAGLGAAWIAGSLLLYLVRFRKRRA